VNKSSSGLTGERKKQVNRRAVSFSLRSSLNYANFFLCLISRVSSRRERVILSIQLSISPFSPVTSKRKNTLDETRSHHHNHSITEIAVLLIYSPIHFLNYPFDDLEFLRPASLTYLFPPLESFL